MCGYKFGLSTTIIKHVQKKIFQFAEMKENTVKSKLFAISASRTFRAPGVLIALTFLGAHIDFK